MGRRPHGRSDKVLLYRHRHNKQWPIESCDSASGTNPWQPLTNITLGLSPAVIQHPLTSTNRVLILSQTAAPDISDSSPRRLQLSRAMILLLPLLLLMLSALVMRKELLTDITRIVVKVGTGVLTDSRKQFALAQVEQLVQQLAEQRKSGREIVLVTSGAVGAGMGVLGYDKRPAELAELQACAAVGQSRLMANYEKLFGSFDIHVAQVLLTHADLEHHERHLNARNTLVSLLRHGIVPIINENDAVSFEELRFGDNDRLSALVSTLLPSDLLVILTTVDGVIENFGKADARTLAVVEQIDDNVEKLAGGTTSATAVGGMASKIQAAKIVIRAGIPMVIASGRKKTVLRKIVDGEDEGTLFVPQAGKLKGRKRWIGFFHHPKGSLFVDDGAKRALRESGKSLLPPGISRCEGDFQSGDIVRICDLNGTEFARGIARFGSKEITGGQLSRVEVIHRDDLVIL